MGGSASGPPLNFEMSHNGCLGGRSRCSCGIRAFFTRGRGRGRRGTLRTRSLGTNTGCAISAAVTTGTVWISVAVSETDAGTVEVTGGLVLRGGVGYPRTMVAPSRDRTTPLRPIIPSSIRARAPIWPAAR